MSRIGTIVLYTLSEQDVREIIERRRDIGARIARGNDVRTGQEYPALIAADWGGSVNLHVFLDGYDTHWATSRPEWTEDKHKLIFFATDSDGDERRLTHEQSTRIKYVPGAGYEGATYQGDPVRVEKEPTHEFTWRPLDVEE
jgi:hypothetical protein